MKLGVVLLAAGRSERFPGNKLLACFRGRPMVSYALSAMQALCGPDTALAAVTGNARIAAAAAQHGCEIIDNPQPELGQAHSIHLAVRWALVHKRDALMLLVGDQPLITGESLKRLAVGFEKEESGVACLMDETHWGNPAIFSDVYFDALLSLSGDRGAKGILVAHEAKLLTVPCVYGNELSDCDTAEALSFLMRRGGQV